MASWESLFFHQSWKRKEWEWQKHTAQCEYSGMYLIVWAIEKLCTFKLCWVKLLVFFGQFFLTRRHSYAHTYNHFLHFCPFYANRTRTQSSQTMAPFPTLMLMLYARKKEKIKLLNRKCTLEKISKPKMHFLSVV